MIVGLDNLSNWFSLSSTLLSRSQTFLLLLQKLFPQPPLFSAFHCRLSHLINYNIWRTPCRMFSFRRKMMFGHTSAGAVRLSSRKAYRHLIGSSWTHLVFKWIWNSSWQYIHKVFLETTRNILKRKNFDLQSFDCALCTNNSEEIMMAHLFLNYDFAKSS